MKYILYFVDSMGSIISVSQYKEGKTLDKFVDDFRKNNSDQLLPPEDVFKIFGKIVGALKALYDTF